MNLEKKFEQIVWWILQELKKESLATPSDHYVKFVFKNSNAENSVIPSTDDQERAVRFLEKNEALKIIKKIYPVPFFTDLNAEMLNVKAKGYLVDLLQPKFNELYQQYEQKNQPKRISRNYIEAMHDTYALLNISGLKTTPDRTKEISDKAERRQMIIEQQRHQEIMLQKQTKLNRILTSKEDKRIHALNTIIERTEPYYPKEKNISIDFYYFNYEDRMDDRKLLEKFLEKVKEYGGFQEFNCESYPNGARFNFIGVDLEKIKTFKEDLEREMTPDKRGSQSSTKSKNTPSFIIEKEIGYLKIGDKKIKIGKAENAKRKCGLLEALCGEFFGKKKLIDAIFESMSLPLDEKDSNLQTEYTALNRKKGIIRTTWKEIQKILKQNKLSKAFTLHIEDKTARFDWI